MALKVVGSTPIIHPIKTGDIFGYLLFFRLSKKVTLNVEVYESALHQRLPCVKGAVILHLLKCKMTEGLCGEIKHIRTGFRRIRNIYLRQPLSQNRLSGAGFASSPYTGEP